LEEIAKDGVMARNSRLTDTAEGFDKRYKEYDALSPLIVARYRSQNKLITVRIQNPPPQSGFSCSTNFIV